MWIIYSALSILYYFTLIDFVNEDVSETLGLCSYLFWIPGLLSAILCFSTDPGVIAKGDLQSPEESEDFRDAPQN